MPSKDPRILSIWLGRGDTPSIFKKLENIVGCPNRDVEILR